MIYQSQWDISISQTWTFIAHYPHDEIVQIPTKDNIAKRPFKLYVMFLRTVQIYAKGFSKARNNFANYDLGRGVIQIMGK